MYYKTLSKYPKFEIMINDIDGRIPSSYVDDWREFQSILNDDFFNSNEKELIYRGQEVYSWALVPSLGRLSDSGTIGSDVANKHLKDFKLSIRGRVNDNSLLSEDIELWALGQHNGLKTPLLDWTYSPYISLFFAFEKNDNLEENEESRAIFILNKKAIEELDSDIFKQPKRNEHSRLINQAGLFTDSIFSTDDTLEGYILNLISKEADVDISNADEVAYYICKIHIPNIKQIECLQHLRMMNIHHASLFPDIIGSSLYCNELTAEYAKSLKIEDVEIEEEQEEKKVFIPTEYESLDSGFILGYIESNPYTVDIQDKKTFSNDLAIKFSSSFSVDWWKRNSIIAKLKNIMRLELRKAKVASDKLNEITEEFIGILIDIEEKKVDEKLKDI